MERIATIVQQYWGYTSLRPLQHEAIAAAIEGHDSLAVMPTGGGKSLCYQVPALLSGKLTVVVSPLIALMKDQVDQLNARGIPSAFYNSSLDANDRRRVMAGIRKREYKLIFVAPERFASEGFNPLLQEVGTGSFAIDEAHCISHWGHDFRGDYRQLGELKRRFPAASVHAFTATATPRVRQDVIAQLGLKDPAVLVGDFFRPNLVYRVQRRRNAFEDVLDEIRQRPGQAGIVYCIRRDDVDDLSVRLRHAGIRAVGYHAGMADEDRTAAQDAFAAGAVDVVAATVAFGMGIDRADIRFVIHAAMPKSIEHYQQETGRAGRDGQPADCILFYSGGDHGLWRTIIEKKETTDRENKLNMLGEMYQLCTGVRCRHQQLVGYFGQTWERASCGACDVCLGNLDMLPDSTIMAQKIMSAVARTHQRFGAAYVTEVLLGNNTDRVTDRGHNNLSVFGLLADQKKQTVLRWIDQLVDQGLLLRDGEYNVLKLTVQGMRVLKSEAPAMLTRPPERSRRDQRRESASRTAAASVPREAEVEPLDQTARLLYERLRRLRREIAEEHNVPAFMVFSDKTLREIARAKPTGERAMLQVKGVGPAKYESFGRRLIEVIRTHPDRTA